MNKKGSKKGQSKAKERYEVTVRRTLVSDRMLMGWPHQKIAADLKVSRQTVTRDVSIIEEGFRKAQTVNVAELKRKVQAEIDTRKGQYWAGWDRSQGVRETKQGKKTPKGEEKSIRQEDQVGDPRFLDGVGKCLDQTIELNGLAPAKQVNLNDISKRPSDQLFSHIAARLPSLARLLAGAGVARGA